MWIHVDIYTNISETKLREPYDLRVAQTSRSNPVQCLSSHQKGTAVYGGYGPCMGTSAYIHMEGIVYTAVHRVY